MSGQVHTLVFEYGDTHDSTGLGPMSSRRSSLNPLSLGTRYLTFRKSFISNISTCVQVACLGVSEPGGGSDVAAATTTAKRYRI